MKLSVKAGLAEALVPKVERLSEPAPTIAPSLIHNPHSSRYFFQTHNSRLRTWSISMADLFSSEWMQTFGEQWNAEPELADALAKIHFNSVIGYGFEDNLEPTGVITVEDGRVTFAGAYSGQTLNWDLRADSAHWKQWLTKGLNMMGLSMAYMTRKLQFRVGDYTAMIKDPRMAGPFIKSFSVMSKV